MDPGTAVAVATLSAKVLSTIWKYYENVEGAQRDIKLLANELEDFDHLMQKFQGLVENNSKLPVAASLDARIKQALSYLKTLESRLNPGTGVKAMRRVGRRALIWPFTKNEVEQWVARFQRLKETANLALNTDQISLIVDLEAKTTQLKQRQEAEEQERQLAKLPLAVDAAFNSYRHQHETLCIENTRVKLLQQHREWGVGHARPLYWLSGMAGTGKSTIARTLAHYFHSIGTLGGSFFFSRSSGEANNAVNFVGTLARHLANISPQLKRSVCEAISTHEDVTRQGLRNQWKELILAPLSNTQSRNRIKLNFVIDALDECGSDDEIRLILQLCVEVKGVKEVDLGVFVTSRPEIAIRLGFEAIPDIIHQKLDLRDVPRHVVEQDLLVLLKHEFSRISIQHKLPYWPRHEDIRSLVRQSDCLFIYATTACRYIGELDWDPEERLSEVLTGHPARGGNTAGLDSMYMQVLTSSLIIGRSEAEIIKMCDRFKQTVGSIVILFDELSISGLAGLLGMLKKSVEPSLCRLHSVLNISKDMELPIRLLHPSFRDFLLDQSRCSDERFCVNRGMKHEELAKHCLRVMSKGLKRNMGHLTTPGSPPEDAERARLNTELPEHVQYACQYWVDHLEGIRADTGAKHSIPDNAVIQSFFQKDFLHWLEAMSLMAKTSQAVLMITRLGDLLKPGSKSTLRAMIADARRFILSNRGIIEKAPLQTYASALVFCPKESFVRHYYLDQMPAWLIRPPAIQNRWGNCIQTLEMDFEAPRCPPLAFSSDGKYIATILRTGEIQMWKIATGAVHSTLEHYEPGIAAFKFLRNGTLASMYYDGTVRLFDQITGVLCRIIERPARDDDLQTIGLDDPQPSLSILPDGDLATLVPNKDIWVWSWGRDSWSKRSIPGITFSRLHGSLSDGTLVGGVSLGDGESIELVLFDPRTNAVQSLEPDLPAKHEAVAISPHDVIAWGTRGRTIELYDADTRSLSKLEGNSIYYFTALTFSPDGRSLISGDTKRSLLLWDLSTEAESLVDTPSDVVYSAAFSPGGQHMAAISRFERTIQLFEFPTNDLSNSGESQRAKISSIDVSPDGQQVVVTFYFEPMIQIYNTESGALEHSLLGHSADVRAVAFSDDSALLASYSGDETIRLWGLQSGACRKIVSGFPGLTGVVILAFSPNRKHLVSGTEEGKILILDAESGVLYHVFELSSVVGATTFSVDGRRIACATVDGDVGDRVIGVWDTSTGKLLHDVGASEYREDLKVAISPNGKYLSYSLGDTAVLIYDMTSKESRDLPMFQNNLTSLAFSRDSKSLATCTYGGEIKLWDVASAQLLGVSPIEAVVYRLSFPTDGTFLESDLGHIPIRREQVYSSSDSSAPHGKVTSAASAIDESAYTKESILLPTKYDDPTLAGTMDASSPLGIPLAHLPGQSRISDTADLVPKYLAAKPSVIARLDPGANDNLLLVMPAS
ncbi:MAG: hypothetical protein Q9184_005817 [Pyrenodesmia sp. 2 TL-2023]